mmetsp:Transcript_42482/g.120115  ORF Transcript_42482/g.120115 Transcript_42482/m.120115 type:complete len:90 (+) Transcript_42482:1115-1384(+)
MRLEDLEAVAVEVAEADTLVAAVRIHRRRLHHRRRLPVKIRKNILVEKRTNLPFPKTSAPFSSRSWSCVQQRRTFDAILEGKWAVKSEK